MIIKFLVLININPMDQEKSKEILQKLVKDLLSAKDKLQYAAVVQEASKLEQNPQVCKASINDIKGIAYYRLEIYKQAVACYKKALKFIINPNYKNNLAVALYQLGENEQANKLLQEATNVMKNPIYHMNIAKLYQIKGDSDTAYKHLIISGQYQSFQTGFDDAKSGLIFNFQWPTGRQPTFGFSFVQKIKKNYRKVISKIKNDLTQNKAIKLYDQVLNLFEEIQKQIQDLQKWAIQTGFIVPKKIQIFKHMLDAFTKASQKIHNELALGGFTDSQKHIEQFLHTYKQTIEAYIALSENPSQNDKNIIINRFIQRKEKLLKSIKAFNTRKSIETTKSESGDIQTKKQIKDKNDSIGVESTKNQLNVEIKDCQPHKMFKPNQQQVIDQQKKSKCQWQLQIKGDRFKAFVSKPSNKQQIKDNVVLNYTQTFKQDMQSCSNQTNSSVKKFYDTLIWVIKLIVFVNGGKTQIKYIQNEQSKPLTVENLIQKIGYIINEITKYEKQTSLCRAVFTAIAQIFTIFKYNFSEKIQKIMIKLNQNFSDIKQNVLDNAVYEKLRDTSIQKQVAEEQQLFRNKILKTKQLSEEDQAVVQNVVVLLIYSQTAKQLQGFSLIGILLEQCFTRKGLTEKEIIIKKIAKKISQSEKSSFSKLS